MTWTFICTLSLGLSVRGLAVSVCAPRAQNSARDRAGAHTAFAEWTGPTDTKPYALVHPASECHPPLTTGTETSQGRQLFQRGLYSLLGAACGARPLRDKRALLLTWQQDSPLH